MLAAGLLERLRLTAAAPRGAEELDEEPLQEPARCVERQGNEQDNESVVVLGGLEVPGAAAVLVEVVGVVEIVDVVVVVAVAAVEEGMVFRPDVGGLAAAVAAVGGASVGHGGRRAGRWKTRREARRRGQGGWYQI